MKSAIQCTWLWIRDVCYDLTSALIDNKLQRSIRPSLSNTVTLFSDTGHAHTPKTLTWRVNLTASDWHLLSYAKPITFWTGVSPKHQHWSNTHMKVTVENYTSSTGWVYNLFQIKQKHKCLLPNWADVISVIFRRKRIVIPPFSCKQIKASRCRVEINCKLRKHTSWKLHNIKERPCTTRWETPANMCYQATAANLVAKPVNC